MTALSFNLTPSKSIDIAGLPLDGLPPLEAGRTLPDAFAELLGKASKLSGKSAPGAENPGELKDGEAEISAEPGGAEPGVEAGLRAPPKVAPAIPSEAAGETAGETEARPAGENEAANGKSLPPVRTELAVAPTPQPAGETGPAVPETAELPRQQGKTGPLGTQDETDAAQTPPASRGDAAPTTTTIPAASAHAPEPTSSQQGKASPVAPEAARVAPEAAPAMKDLAGAKPEETRSTEPGIERKEHGKAASSAPVAVPGGQPAPIEFALDAPETPPPPPAPAPTPASAPVDGVMAVAAANVAVAQQDNATADITTTPPAPGGASAPAPTGFAKAESAAPQTAQQFLGGDNTPDGEGKGRSDQARADQSKQPASQSSTHSPASAPARNTSELPQTGLSLQLRAADRPVPATEVGQPSVQSGNGSSSSQAIAAPLSHTPFATTTLGTAPQTGPLPHFPDLAALVDRIAAARSSAGSASATIAVAHKELGNLSLTFEASGNTLDVEVAAQDSDTQRALAAAIATDRPHMRTVDAQAQAPTQTLHSQLASSAHGGGTDARQSGMAGDAQPDRRGDGRGSNRQGGGAGAQGRPDPKSDGGIYA